VDVLSVFVASPSDVADERAKLEEVIRELNLVWSRKLGVQIELIRWETHAFPSMGDDAQAIINEQIPDDYDLFLGLMWHRFGTPTGRAGSGTLEEFQRAKARFDADGSSVKLMIYFKNAAVSPSEIDPVQLGEVKKFRESLASAGALYWEFTDLDNFAQLARIHISKQLQAFKDSLISRGDTPTARVIQTNPSENEPPPLEAEEDAGFLDLVDVFEERMGELTEIAERISEATSALGAKVTRCSQSFQQLPVDSTGTPSRTETRRLLSLLAGDMNEFCRLVESQVPRIRPAFREGIGALIRVIPLSKELGQTDTQIKKLLPQISDLRGNINGSVRAIRGYRDTINLTPRLTSELNKAKHSTVSVLDKLLAELEAGEMLLGEAAKSFHSII
jgi:hypothetical protein